jgi:hypothetical protein
MAAYAFRVIVKGTARIFMVNFHPEGDEQLLITWHRQSGFKNYTSDEFHVDVRGPLDFTLIVGARETTKYTYSIQVKDKSKWVEIIKETRELVNSNKDTVNGSVQIPASTTTLPVIV